MAYVAQAPARADSVTAQLVGEFIAQAKPVVRDEIVPILTRDPALQKTMATAAGQAIAPHVAAPLWVAAGALVVGAGALVWKVM